jgi:hypothetical protein
VHCRDHLNARHAVDRAVVQLQRHRERALRDSRHGIQPFDDSDLPRRTSQVDRSGVQARDLDTQLPPVTRLGQPDMTDVILKIETWVIDPVRPMETARQLGQPAPKGIREMQPGVELVKNPFEGHLAVPGGRRVVDQQHLDL